MTGKIHAYLARSVYAEMTAYAKVNDLKFKTQEDLLKILDHYKELLKK
jgi:hypothetical protein